MKIIPVIKTTLNLFIILSVTKDRHRVVEWLVLDPDW